MHLSPLVAKAAVRPKAVVLLWLTYCLLLLPLWESAVVLFFCCTLLYVHSSFAIISMGKRELVALLTYDQEIPQSQTANKTMAPRERATQQSRDTRKTN